MSPLKEGVRILVLCEGEGGLRTSWDGLGRLSDDQSRRESKKSLVWPQGIGL